MKYNYRTDLDVRTNVRILILEARDRIFKALHLENCMLCRWGIAKWNNEITLKGHIGVIGLRCNKCQHHHDARQFRAELIA